MICSAALRGVATAGDEALAPTAGALRERLAPMLSDRAGRRKLLAGKATRKAPAAGIVGALDRLAVLATEACTGGVGPWRLGSITRKLSTTTLTPLI